MSQICINEILFRKLLTSICVVRITKQKKENPQHGDTLFCTPTVALANFHTLVQLGISLVLSQAFPTPPEQSRKKQKKMNK